MQQQKSLVQTRSTGCTTVDSIEGGGIVGQGGLAHLVTIARLICIVGDRLPEVDILEYSRLDVP